MSIGARLVQHRDMRPLVQVLVLALGASVATAEPCKIAAPAGGSVDVDGLRATLHWPDGASRVVDAASCGELVDAAALIVDMARTVAPRAKPAKRVDPPADDAPAAVEVEPVAEEDVAIPSAPVARVTPVELAEVVEQAPDATPALATNSLGVVAGGGATRGSHGWLTTVDLGARWRRGDGSLELDVSAVMPDRVQVTATGSVGVWSVAATAAPCLHVGPVAACALASVGAVVGEGAGLTDARRATTPLFALGGRLAAETAVSTRLSLRLRADVLGNVTASRFDVDGMTVWATDRVAAWLGADAILRFP